MNIILDSSSLYFPIDLVVHKKVPIFKLIKLPEDVFDKPFYDIAVSRYLKQNQNIPSKLVSIDELGEIISKFSLLSPTGFIYHLSHCGSTLISQMLATSDNIRVVSEPEVITKLLNSACSREIKLRSLDLLFRIFGISTGHKQYLIFKFSSNTLLHLPGLIDVFPQIPWLFLHRNPVEVLTSIIEDTNRDRRYLNKLHYDVSTFIGEQSGVPESSELEEYAAKIMCKKLELVIDNYNEQSQIINYSKLPGAVIDRIIPHFSMEINQSDQSKMLERSSYKSKGKSQEQFIKASAKKHHVTDRTNHAVTKWVTPAYTKLCEIDLKE